MYVLSCSVINDKSMQYKHHDDKDHDNEFMMMTMIMICTVMQCNVTQRDATQRNAMQCNACMYVCVDVLMCWCVFYTMCLYVQISQTSS